MKVHDIITEAGVFDKLKSSIKGAVSGYKSSQAARQQERDLASDSVLQDALKSWGNYVADVERKGQDVTPDNYEKHLNNWLGKQWFKLTSPWVGSTRLPDMSNPATANSNVTKYIAQALKDYRNIREKIRAKSSSSQPAGPGPEDDISKTLDPYTQYKFEHPDYPGVNIIVRQGRWYIDRLPQQLRGQVQRDKETKLFPVLQPSNIKKYNKYYNDAADMGKVKEEPAVAL